MERSWIVSSDGYHQRRHGGFIICWLTLIYPLTHEVGCLEYLDLA